MTCTLARTVGAILILGLLVASSGCVNTWGATGDSSYHYYQRARIASYEPFPGAYSSGAYGRYGRYGPYGRY